MRSPRSPLFRLLAQVLIAALVLTSLPPVASASYERTYVLQKPATLATVRFGYADGYEFHLSNAGEVAIGEKLVIDPAADPSRGSP